MLQYYIIPTNKGECILFQLVLYQLSRIHHRWYYVVDDYLDEWTKLYKDWLTNYHNPLHVVFYENLVNDTRNELQAILDFLNVTVTEVYIEHDNHHLVLRD